MGVIIPGDFKVVHIKRYFALNVFVLTRFHCTVELLNNGHLETSHFVLYRDYYDD